MMTEQERRQQFQRQLIEALAKAVAMPADVAKGDEQARGYNYAHARLDVKAYRRTTAYENRN